MDRGWRLWNCWICRLVHYGLRVTLWASCDIPSCSALHLHLPSVIVIVWVVIDDGNEEFYYIFVINDYCSIVILAPACATHWYSASQTQLVYLSPNIGNRFLIWWRSYWRECVCVSIDFWSSDVATSQWVSVGMKQWIMNVNKW